MWITQEKLPLGEHIARYVDWLTQHGAGVFDS
jgi:glycine betaine/proline transport system permease protein